MEFMAHYVHNFFRNFLAYLCTNVKYKDVIK